MTITSQTELNSSRQIRRSESRRQLTSRRPPIQSLKVFSDVSWRRQCSPLLFPCQSLKAHLWRLPAEVTGKFAFQATTETKRARLPQTVKTALSVALKVTGDGRLRRRARARSRQGLANVLSCSQQKEDVGRL